jgi:hypothetical protein
MNTVTEQSLDKIVDRKTKGSLPVLLTLAIGFVMAMIDVTAVNVALPDVSVSDPVGPVNRLGMGDRWLHPDLCRSRGSSPG